MRQTGKRIDVQRYPGFLGPSYAAPSVVWDSERCINWFPEFAQSPGQKSPIALLPTPGVAAFYSGASAPCRGLFAQDGRAFAVLGYVLLELAANGTATARGTVADDGLPVTMCSSGDAGGELFITSGNNGYVFTLATNTLTHVLTGVSQGGFLNGYFFALNRDTSELQCSDLLDGLTWNPLRVQSRNAASDKWRGMVIANSLIWLFGSETSEVWYDAGLTPFPAQLVAGAVLQHGTAAPWSIAPLGNLPTWLGQTRDGEGMVFQAGDGFTAKRISNHAVESAIQAYLRAGGVVEDAEAFSYQEDGHLFYQLTFPSVGATWVYDLATQQWHERLFWNTTTGEWEASRARWHAYAFGKHLVGDRLLGNVYHQALTSGTDVGGVALRRVRQAPHLHRRMQQQFFSSFEVHAETGLGLVSGQGSDPQMMLQVSDDGGRTFWDVPTASAGKMGEYRRRVQWWRLGCSRDAVFRVVASDPIPWRLVDAYLGGEEGTS